MTNEEIYELAEEHGDWDDFGRWTFRDNDRLLAFVDAILKVERETCAVLIESTPTMLGSPKREWVGLTDEEIYDYADKFLYQHGSNFGIKSFGKAIEAKLKEKNHGNT
jgi:hypothetical protein